MVGAEPGPGGGPHAFVADLDAPELSDEDRHHLGRALRLRDGDPLTVSDGQGRWRPVRFGAELELAGDIVEVPSPPYPVTVALTPVKGQRPEWAVQKLTELGVDAIWLLIADRSVVRWEGPKAAAHSARLAKVAREAAMQSHRCRLPEIRAGLTVAEAAAEPAAGLADMGAEPLGADVHTVLIGPEGGWSDRERAGASVLVGLGPTILRAETAAVAAGVLLSAARAAATPPKGSP